jgi:hypothetical protein
MKLSANPFDTHTGELLPVYRDAYLRGDLASASAQAVERYLQHDAGKAHATVVRWYQLRDPGSTPPTAWLGKQLRFMAEQPRRFRRRVLGFGLMSTVLAGAALATNRVPTPALPAARQPSSLAGPVEAVSAPTAGSLVVLHGLILNEQGRPLPGATVLQKGTTYGTSTDAQGQYTLYVPATEQAILQYGYGGYVEQELPARSAAATSAIVLQPKPSKHHYWPSFKKLFTKVF